MTTTHAAALTLIEERLALVEAGTAGPWVWNVADSLHDDAAGWVGHDRTGDGFQEYVASTSNHPDGLNDGALIVAAVNDYAPLLMLARDVLVRHAPRVFRPPYSNRNAALAKHLCRQCPQHEWPCPDVTAVLRSVGLVTE